MDWVEKARRVFKVDNPIHFTDFNHCEECAEHDATLVNSDIDKIRLAELGNPGWDPICFCSNEGKKYYMPAFVRLSLETIADEFYLEQFLFHLEWDGENNGLFLECSQEQRVFISQFVSYMISQYPNEIEKNMQTDPALRVNEIWSKAL